MQPSAALRILFADTTTPADRDRLVGALADFDLISIHENDPVRPTEWTAHFGDERARDSAAAAIQGLPGNENLRLERCEIEDEDWARRTQADLPAVRIGRILVAPPWDLPPGFGQKAPSSEVVVVIEPSRGFGTGHHQSTRLCLALLQNRDVEGRTAIDVGTGSGVLAIAAARLGAAYVTAIDVDPDAIESARENIARNEVANVVDAHVVDLSRATLSPADIVTANLTGSLLERHAPELARLVKPAGVLIAAGFTIDERDRVVQAFAPGMSVAEMAEEEGWIAAAFSNF